ELLQQQELPEPVELGARVLAAARSAEELRVVQRDLGAAVAALRPTLGRVRPAVQLEVQLTDDDGARAGLGLELVEEPLRRCQLGAGETLQVARAAERLDHRSRRPAAAVAVAVDEQAAPRVQVVLVVAS